MTPLGALWLQESMAAERGRTMHGAHVTDMTYRGEKGENERRREVSGGLLSWRDDPEKSVVQNGLPGKEVYSIGRRRQRGRRR